MNPWLALAARSERSAREKRLGNQDCVLTKVAADHSVVAVADGHGSAKAARSAVGAELACAAMSTVGQWVSDRCDSGHRSGVGSLIDRSLGNSVVDEWERLIVDHFTAVPPRQYELESLGIQESEWDNRYRGSDGALDVKSVRSLYGTTALGVVATERLVVAWQLGDGLTRVVDQRLKLSEPHTGMPRQLGETTESLATIGADRLFFVRTWWSEGADWPQLVLLCSDGVEKAYSDLGLFDERVRSMAMRLRDGSLDDLGAELGQLVESGKKYSGDDASVAVVFRPMNRTQTGGQCVARG